MLAVALMFRNGWEVRKNQIIDYRSAEGMPSALLPLAADLVALKHDLLLGTHQSSRGHETLRQQRDFGRIRRVHRANSGTMKTSSMSDLRRTIRSRCHDSGSRTP